SQQVAQMLKDMLQGVTPEVARGRDTTVLKEILDKTAERVGRGLTDQPEVEIELRNTLAWAYGEIGLNQQKEDMARKSVEIARLPFGNDSPILAESLNVFGDALRQDGKLEQAEAITREAVALGRRLGDKQKVARALEYFGYALQARGKLGENEAACVER